MDHQHTDEITEFLESSTKHQKTAWGYLLDLVDPFTGMTVSLVLEAKDRVHPRLDASAEDAAAQVVEQAFQEPQVQIELRTAIETSILPLAHRKQLLTGLAFVETQDHELAVPLLIIALEGAFWRLASEHRLIEKNTRGHWMTIEEIKGKKHRIRAIDSLVKLQGLDLDPKLVCFIVTLTYGSAGNDFRHGTATDGWRLRSTFLTAALLGWLDATGAWTRVAPCALPPRGSARSGVRTPLTASTRRSGRRGCGRRQRRPRVVRSSPIGDSTTGHRAIKNRGQLPLKLTSS